MRYRWPRYESIYECGQRYASVMHMHGYKFLRTDLQEELIRRAQHERMVHVVDDEGFVVVRSEDEHLRLEKIKVEIGTGALG